MNSITVCVALGAVCPTVPAYESGDGADFLGGGTDNDSLIGGAGNDDLVGGTGNDTLDGGADDSSLLDCDNDDCLLGGGGNDVVAFAATKLGIDTVIDFSPLLDAIDLRGFFGFVVVTTATSVSTSSPAISAVAQLAYDQSTGLLAWDADGAGSGAALGWAVIAAKPLLTAADFAVVA